VPRACHLITRLIVGGAQRIALETAAFLAGSGWSVELWAGPQTGSEGSLHEEARRRGVPLREVPDLVRELSPAHDARALIWLRREFSRQRFDLVHTHSSKAGILGRHAAHLARVPVRVHSVHGWGTTPDTPSLTRKLFDALERSAARRAHALIAVSEAVRDAGLACGIGSPAQYRVIRGGISLGPVPDREARRRARAELGLPEEALVAGTIGRLDHAKDPLGALDALRPLLDAEPRARAVFIGDGPLRDAMRRAVLEGGMRERVLLPGRRGDARALAAAFDVFFLASRWEGFPLAVIEAMAGGLPVVAYDVAGVREAVAEGMNGHLIAPGNREAWRARIAGLLADEATRLRLGTAGRRRAEREFDLARMLAETRALYEELIPTTTR
jgi:glycosyltransferase involved in cell wall biosynthesis